MNFSDMKELVFLWTEYAIVGDGELTTDAQKLKKLVIKFVRTLPKLPKELQNKGTIEKG